MFGRMLMVLAAVALVVGVACGGGDDDGDDASDGGDATTSAPAATEPPTESEKPDDEEAPTEGGSSDAASLPDDACTLLTAEQVAPLVPDPQAPDTRTGTEAEGEFRGCHWSSSSAPVGLELTLISLPPDFPGSVVVEGLRSELENNPDARELDGLGEYAIIITRTENSAEIASYMNGLQMGLSISGVGAPDEAQLIELARAVEDGL